MTGVGNPGHVTSGSINFPDEGKFLSAKYDAARRANRRKTPYANNSHVDKEQIVAVSDRILVEKSSPNCRKPNTNFQFLPCSAESEPSGVIGDADESSCSLRIPIGSGKHCRLIRQCIEVIHESMFEHLSVSAYRQRGTFGQAALSDVMMDSGDRICCRVVVIVTAGVFSAQRLCAIYGHSLRIGCHADQ